MPTPGTTDQSRTSSRLSAPLAFVAVGLAALLGSCGSPTAEVPAPADSASLLAGIDPLSTSPLTDFLGLDINDAEALRTNRIGIESEAGTIAQQCMLQDGFDFTPPRSTGQSALGPTGEDLPPASDEWVAKYGFGITTLYLAQTVVGELVGIPEAELPITGADVDEMNREYTESLSESELQAYNLAYRGQPSESNLPQGCLGEAMRHIRAASLDRQGLLGAFSDELDELQTRIDADPRVIEYYSSVGECVANDGLWFAGFSDVSAEFSAALVDVQAMVEQDSTGQLSLNPEGLALLAELQMQELALAQSVVGCGGGPDQTKQAIGSVIAEHERAFLAENAGELAQFLPEGS